MKAQELLQGFNKAVGYLVNSDRAVNYLEILLVLLDFRERHELEPLHEDVLAALGTEEKPADASAFAQDIRQLLDWGLVSQRIEKERLRGYRDTRRRKFRYRIGDDAVSFVQWLAALREERLRPDDTTAPDLLSDLISSLKETGRLINNSKTFAEKPLDYEKARMIYHRVAKMAATTDQVTRWLGEFNIRLLSFLDTSYKIETALQLIRELEHFTDRFIKRIYLLRNEIYPEIGKLLLERLASRWEACRATMEAEADATRLLVRARLFQPRQELTRMADFYRAEGALELQTARVSRSALMVWQKLHAHLRELERRSHRLEDIRIRIKEMAAMPAAADPGKISRWIASVFEMAHLRGDLHEWTENVKAEPPQPLWTKTRLREEQTVWLEERKLAGGKPPQSLEEHRLEVLKAWMAGRGLLPPEGAAAEVSNGVFTEFEDFPKIMELARSGLLGEGRRLAKIGLTAETLPKAVEVRAAKSELAFDEIVLRRMK